VHHFIPGGPGLANCSANPDWYDKILVSPSVFHDANWRNVPAVLVLYSCSD